MADILNKPIPSPKNQIQAWIRASVWWKRFGLDTKGICRCSRVIYVFTFECGHVIARANGGLDIISNLEPICHDCNVDMKTENLYEYFEKHQYPELICDETSYPYIDFSKFHHGSLKDFFHMGLTDYQSYKSEIETMQDKSPYVINKINYINQIRQDRSDNLVLNTTSLSNAILENEFKEIKTDKNQELSVGEFGDLYERKISFISYIIAKIKKIEIVHISDLNGKIKSHIKEIINKHKIQIMDNRMDYCYIQSKQNN